MMNMDRTLCQALLMVVLVIVQTTLTWALDDVTFDEQIVGGTWVRDPDKYPWHVHWPRGCGGSLIHPDIILTAAHCYDNTGYFDTVFIGGNKRKGGTKATIVQQVKHPDYMDLATYSDGPYVNDFLLLKLSSPVNLPTIELNAHSTYPTDGHRLTVIGYGRLHEFFSYTPSTLRQVVVPYVSDAECQDSYDLTTDMIDDQFCAGYKTGLRDSCFGDSGSPIFDEKGLQVGIVSWGIGCARPRRYGVYSRVSAGLGWIEQTICSLSSSPPATC